MRYSLLPNEIKLQMRAIKKVGVMATVGAIILLIMMRTLGFFSDLTTGIIFTLVIAAVLVPILFPVFAYQKVSQASVQFTQNSIEIVDEKGKCLRSVKYYTIRNVQIRDVKGFFYGQNQDLYQYPYICIYLNGATEIPQVCFRKLFTHKDFLMISYHEKVLEDFLQASSHNTNLVTGPDW